ncbi:MAG TPA: WecB/TagA/CpsF family glycosyltransferase [Verrucomicrobiae bacterium]|jgi:N-acetylglucosaminyldiphosphoundecaprenol N-acetyl-beta-D-mannosaminyltransferase|nr:WecB/TagA/CpsF family glycosyltransferase [Verrucomicrobiae bacterium]
MPPTREGLPRANVLGVGIHAIAMQEALRESEWALQQRRKAYICVTGVHGVMEAQSDLALRDILNGAFLCTPDGMPTVWVGRCQGYQQMRRVYGPDFMWELCRQSVKPGYRHFLYGGKPGVADTLKLSLEKRIPGILICGTYTPPFQPLTPQEEDRLTNAVNSACPDIVWVGLSTPKQEHFMGQFLDRLNTSLMIGVGAAFDIHAGLVPDAPGWMKASGLQWLHRLYTEPRRLWRRYLSNNPRFLWKILLQLTRLKSFSLNTAIIRSEVNAD